MIFRLAVLATAITLLYACGHSPVNTTTPRKDTVVQNREKKDSLRADLLYPQLMYTKREAPFNSYYLRIKDSMYYCSYKGKIECADTMGRHRHYLFNIKAEFVIDAVYIHPLSANEYYVEWQETDHLGVKSYFAKFQRGNDKPQWKMKVEAPSPGDPVVDSPYVFVSTLGMIAKLDMNSGEPAWRYDSLFDPLKLTFKQFGRPRVYSSTVCYFDLPIAGKKNRRDTIWVNDRTGQLVR